MRQVLQGLYHVGRFTLKPQFKLAASLVIAAAAAQVAHPAQAAPQIKGTVSASAGVSGPQNVVPGEILVTYKEDAKSVRATNVRSLLSARVLHTFGQGRIQTLKLPPVLSIAKAMELLEKQSVVEAAQPNYQYSMLGNVSKTIELLGKKGKGGSSSPATYKVNDPSFKKQWDMTKIQADTAWNATYSNTEVVVAVMDSGINYNHEDLIGAMWRNPDEIPGNGFDDDANGYIDDVFGIDTGEGDSAPLDDKVGHGTHVAGTIAAVGNNKVGIVGVAGPTNVPGKANIKLMALKIANAAGGVTTSDKIRLAMDYIVLMKQRGTNIRVTNQSWGGWATSGKAFDPVLKLGFDAMGTQGIISAIAAGNDGTSNDTRHSYPANYTSAGIVSVAASDSSDKRPGFSNYGAQTVHIAAPGKEIFSTYPFAFKGGKKTYPGGDYTKPPVITPVTSSPSNKAYDTLDGTSMAAPHVAGAAALLFAFDSSLTADEAIIALQAGSDQLTQWKGVVKWGGRLNVARSLAFIGAPLGIPSPTPPPAPTATPDPTATPVPTVVPPAPTGLSATAGNSQVSLQWSPAAGASLGYNIYRSLTPGGPYSFVANTLATNYVDTGRTNGITYYYVVRGMNLVGEGPNSNEASATPNGPPAAPTNLTATAGNSQVTLNWTASAGATSYNIYRATAPFADGTIANLLVTGVTGTTYADTSVTNGTTYYYRIKAVNAAGAGPVSNQASATPQETLPAAPTGLTATAGNAKITLAWNAVPSATSYNVYRSTTNGGPYTKINLSPVTTTTYEDSSVNINVTYYYVVRAVNVAGESANSNQASATPIGYPAAPGSLVAIAGDKQISLTWGPATGATSYSLYRSTTTGTGYVLVIDALTGTSYTDTGLTNGQTYYYVVRGVNSAGEGPNSNEASATPSATAPETGENGDVIYANGGEIWKITSSGSDVKNLTQDPAYDFSPAVSQQDGRVIFVSRLNDLGNLNNELYIMNADGSNQTRLTNNNFDDRDPAWSPDGQWVAFVRDSNGGIGAPNYDIYIMKAQPENNTNTGQGINIPIQITSDPGLDRDPAWSRDKIGGKWRLAFTSNRTDVAADDSQDNDIWALDFNPTNPTSAANTADTPVNITGTLDGSDADDRNPSFSPFFYTGVQQDLTYRLAYQSDRDGDYEIYTIRNTGVGINTAVVPTRITNNVPQFDDSYVIPDDQEIPGGSNADTNSDPTYFDTLLNSGWDSPGDPNGYMYLLNSDPLYDRFTPSWDGPSAPYGSAIPDSDLESVEDIDPHFSPDGQWITFSSNEGGGGIGAANDNDFDLFVIGVDSRGRRRVTTNKANGNGRDIGILRYAGVQDSEPAWIVKPGTGVPPGPGF